MGWKEPQGHRVMQAAFEALEKSVPEDDPTADAQAAAFGRAIERLEPALRPDSEDMEGTERITVAGQMLGVEPAVLAAVMSRMVKKAQYDLRLGDSQQTSLLGTGLVNGIMIGLAWGRELEEGGRRISDDLSAREDEERSTPS